MLSHAVESTLDDATVAADAAVRQPAACLLPHGSSACRNRALLAHRCPGLRPMSTFKSSPAFKSRMHSLVRSFASHW
jgi:hypothetical protein